MSEKALDRFRETSRRLPIGVAAIGVVAILSAAAILLAARWGAAQRDDLQFYHLQSQVVLRHILAHAGNLRRGSGTATERELSLLVASIRKEIDRLGEIQSAWGSSDFGGALDRLRSRFDRVQRYIEAGTPSQDVAPETLVPAIGSMVLAADQLDRLHGIEVRASIVELSELFRTQLSLFVVASALIATLAFGFSRWLLIALDEGFEREQALLSASRERLAHSQKIEALGRLAGGVAHDFNNLLTVILGNVDTLRREIPTEDPLQCNAQEIEAASEQAASLTRQLLVFSRRDATEARSVDLNELVAQSESMLTRIIREDVVLVTELEPGLRHVRGDPTQLQQIVLNLVLNARDAMPGGGTVTIQTATASGVPPGREASGADAAGTGAWARLTVRDTGTGIPAEIRDRIFEPYFTTKPYGEGTGLGLATVLATVEQNNGSIVVDSEEARGSQFDIYLPMASGPAPAPARASDVAPGGTETILVVEDVHNLRRLTTRMLAEVGFQVLEAADGMEALRICEERKEPIDLILTDIVMPNLKGPELAERAKDSHPEVRILFMSGYADRASLRHLRESPEKLLQKPFRRDQLLSRVRAALSNRTSI